MRLRLLTFEKSLPPLQFEILRQQATHCRRAYFLVDYLRNDGVGRSTVIVSSALVGTGLLAGILKKKVFKPDSKRTLTIIRF